MTDYDVYVSLLCLITYIMFTLLSVFCIAVITRLSIKLIRSGAEDKKIVREYKRNVKFGEFNNYTKNAAYFLTSVVFVALLLVFVFSLAVQYADESVTEYVPVYRVVQTGSMAEKHPKNTYLEANGLDNQIQTFDLIKTTKMPDEMDLQLYDIVVYEIDGLLVVHRIVGIEEPNENHPGCRHFRLQGDAVESPDKFIVTYDQMRGIYEGDRTPFVGSFIMFMQSPTGWLCILLVIISVVVTPILEGKIEKEKERRLKHYLSKLN